MNTLKLSYVRRFFVKEQGFVIKEETKKRSLMFSQKLVTQLNFRFNCTIFYLQKMICPLFLLCIQKVTPCIKHELNIEKYPISRRSFYSCR